MPTTLKRRYESVCDEIDRAYRDWHFTNQLIQKCDKQTLAFVRSWLGWHGSDQGTRDQIKARCDAIKKAVIAVYETVDLLDPAKCKPAAFKGWLDDLADRKVACDVSTFVIAHDVSMFEWIERQKMLKKRLTALGEELPCAWLYPTINGLSAYTVAKLIGAAGNLDRYENPAKLWKYMGCAPPQCYRMETKAGKDALRIPRQKRSIAWQLGYNVRMQPSDITQAYFERKEYELEKFASELNVAVDDLPKKVRSHATKRAKRWLDKRLLLLIWKAWHEGDASDRIAA